MARSGDLDRATLWLVAGAAAGVVLAAAGILGSAGTASLPPDAAVSVNGEIIRRDDYERAVAAIRGDRRTEISDDDRRRVLERLVEEELLVQRALELGLARSDARVRGELTRAVIAAVLASAEDGEPDDTEIESFYSSEREFFARSPRLRVRSIFFRDTEARDEAPARARRALELLRAGQPFEEVRNTTGDRELVPIPDTPLPAEKLRDYLGPSAVRALLPLDAGAVSEPFVVAGGVRLIEVLERTEARIPPLEEIPEEVRVELRRRRGERALRAYLDELRARATIERSDDLP